MRASPVLAGLPLPDQLLLALLYRLHVDAQHCGDRIYAIRTAKALDAAERAARAIFPLLEEREPGT